MRRKFKAKQLVAISMAAVTLATSAPALALADDQVEIVQDVDTVQMDEEENAVDTETIEMSEDDTEEAVVADEETEEISEITDDQASVDTAEESVEENDEEDLSGLLDDGEEDVSLEEDANAELVGRNKFFVGEAVKEITVQLADDNKFDAASIEKNKNKWNKYVTFAGGLNDVSIKNVECVSDKVIKLSVTGTVRSSVVNNAGVCMDAINIDSRFLADYAGDDLTITPQIADLGVNLTILKVDGEDAGEVSDRATTIAGTIEVEEVEGVDTYFKETAEDGTQITLNLDGAFKGASATVSIDNNKLNFEITNSKPVMTENIGNISVSGKYTFTNSDIDAGKVNIKATSIEKETTEKKEEKDKQANPGTILKDILSATAKYVTSTCKEMPLVGVIADYASNSLSGIINGTYVKSTDNLSENIRQMMAKNLEETKVAINNATSEILKAQEFDGIKKEQNELFKEINSVKSLYTTRSAFYNVAWFVDKCREEGDVEYSEEELKEIDRIMQSLYSSDLSSEYGEKKSAYVDDVLTLGNHIVSDDTNAFVNNEKILEYANFMNCDCFYERDVVNTNLMSVYTYVNRLMLVAAKYDLQKHTEISARNEEVSAILSQNNATKINATTAVINELENQYDRITKAYEKSQNALIKEKAAYDSADKIAKIYGIGDNNEGKYISLNVNILDANENIKQFDPYYYNWVWESLKRNNQTCYEDYTDWTDGSARIFNQYFIDHSSFWSNSYEFKYNGCLADNDADDTVNPFANYNLKLTDEDGNYLKNKLVRKGYTATNNGAVRMYLMKYMFMDGKKISDEIIKSQKYGEIDICGIYCGGGVKKDIEIKKCEPYDSGYLRRTVNVFDDDAKITNKNTLTREFVMGHKFGWGFAKAYRMDNYYETVSSLEKVNGYYGKLNGRGHEGVLCIKEVADPTAK